MTISDLLLFSFPILLLPPHYYLCLRFCDVSNICVQNYIAFCWFWQQTLAKAESAMFWNTVWPKEHQQAILAGLPSRTPRNWQRRCQPDSGCGSGAPDPPSEISGTTVEHLSSRHFTLLFQFTV